VKFRTGITDGTNTEVTSGDLQQGTELVTGIVLPTAQRAAAGATGNPLLGQQGNGLFLLYQREYEARCAAGAAGGRPGDTPPPV